VPVSTLAQTDQPWWSTPKVFGMVAYNLLMRTKS